MDLKKNNVVFIDQNVKEFSLFLNNVNDVTLPIVYHSSTTREEILSQLVDFSHFDRIAFVFHGIYPGCYYDKPFLENQPYFTLDGSGNIVVTENVTFIQTILSTYTVSHVDFLGCNLLLSKEWRDYFDLLGGFGGIVVGASNDNTGNLKYGGDWILENTMEDVRNVYFSSGLDSYSGLLITSAITTSVTLTDSAGTLSDGTTNYVWSTNGYIPITGNNIIVRFGGSVNITTVQQTFSITGSNVIVDGGNNTVTISSVLNYPALFYITSGSNITIKNIIINSTGTTSSGSYNIGLFGGSTATGPNILFQNCSTKGIYNTPGGIFFGGHSFQGNVSFINCSNSIPMPNNDQGGLFPFNCSITNNYGCSLNVINCYNNGNISGQNSSGLVGAGFSVSEFGGIVNIIGCYNTGNINCSKWSGAISGGQIGLKGGGEQNPQPNASIVVNLRNCYNVGSIRWTANNPGSDNGALFGRNQGFHAISASSLPSNYTNTFFKTYNISNCYNLGSITTTSNYGEIIGGFQQNYVFVTNFYSALTTINFNNCYCKGNLFGRPEGITHAAPVCNVTNCYIFRSTWVDTNATGNLINTPSSVFSPGSVWTSVAANTPYLLSSYVGNAYNPSSETTGTSSFTSPTPTSGYSYGLLNTLAYGTINTTTGVITFASIPTTSTSYQGNIVAYNLIDGQYANYFFTSYSLRFLKTPILYYYSLTTPNMGGSIEN